MEALRSGKFRLVLATLLVAASLRAEAGRFSFKDFLKLPTEGHGDEEGGTRWAILVAGSSGYGNYRHQADVCHAYQLLHKGGLKDENIIVMMFDDIAGNLENPHPGTVINRPYGPDVYQGVPKDYTGRNVTAANFLAVLRGNRTAVEGQGSGRVIESGPNDRIFVFYSDHGGPGVLGMPTLPFLYAVDIMETFKAMHAANSFKEMVFYLEACESGSVFQGMLPDNIKVYATTAANAVESSWGTYCPGMWPPPPPEYETCLGDLYSVAWMEDSEIHNLRKETLLAQYEVVKDRTSNHGTFQAGSHVMQYGSVDVDVEECALYMGNDPQNDNLSYPNGLAKHEALLGFYQGKQQGTVLQRDADLLHIWQKYSNAPAGSPRKHAALEELKDSTKRRAHVDRSVALIGKLLFGASEGQNRFETVRMDHQPLVDDWACLKATVRAYETHCGQLTQYGMKHMRAFANICNAGINPDQVQEAAEEACADAYANGLAAPLAFSA